MATSDRNRNIRTEPIDPASVRLAPMTAEMYHSFFKEFENDPDLLMPGQPFVPYVYSKENVDRYIQKQKDLNRVPLAVFCGREIAGEILIKGIEPGKCTTMSITLKNPSFKDRGIGTEAEKQAVCFVFRELGIPTLYADALKTNMRSCRVLEKAGFVRVREDEFYNYYRIEKEDRDG